jgi:hypothetical protein
MAFSESWQSSSGKFENMSDSVGTASVRIVLSISRRIKSQGFFSSRCLTFSSVTNLLRMHQRPVFAESGNPLAIGAF